MATEEMIIQLSDTDRELIRRLTDALEGARPPRSNSVEPFVGPPDVNQGEPAALARPATLAKLKSFVRERIHEVWLIDELSAVPGKTVVKDFEYILQQLNDLDQGPIAQRLSEQKNHKSVKDYIDSLTVY